MRLMMIGTTRLLITGLLVTVLLALTSAWSQAQDPLQDVEKGLMEKCAAAETHRQQMEGLKDPEKRATAMQRHCLVTEEVLALSMQPSSCVELCLRLWLDITSRAGRSSRPQRRDQRLQRMRWRC